MQKTLLAQLLTLLLAGLAVSVRADVPTNAPAAAAATAPTVETLVCIRHGEKPKGGLGQLTCRGLNRALALPDVLLAKFGRPDFIFAPDPSEKLDGLIGYNYIRPLMTIEPTAIRCGLPVNTTIGYLDIGRLEKELEKPAYQGATVFVAWEHGLLHEFAKSLLSGHGDDPKQVPAWPGSDFDTIYIFKITRANGHKTVTFIVDHEGLNGLSDNCPGPAK